MRKMRMASIAAATLLLAACAQDDLVKAPSAQNGGDMAMTFSARSGNMTRATTDLNDAGYTQFGVWTVKTPTSGTAQQVMANYLVNYSTTDPGDGKNDTWGSSSNLTDATSYWYYQGLGTADGATASQELKYWDTGAASYEFYAYVPYAKSGNIGYQDGTVAFDLNNGKITFNNVKDGIAQNGVKQWGYKEYMTAYEKRSKTGTEISTDDVPLTFKRLNGKLELAFYETIVGYDVEITAINTKTIASATDNTATPICVSGKMEATKGVLAWTPNTTDKQVINWDWTIPGAGVNIADNRANPTPALDTYFCVQQPDAVGASMLVTISYTLKSALGETIDVTGTVVISPDYMKWKYGESYTYVFRLGVGDLKPIVFDGIKVTDYVESEVPGSVTTRKDYRWIVNEAGTNPESDPLFNP